MGIIIGIVGIGIFMLLRVISNLRNDRDWDEGLFESEGGHGNSEDPLLEAYISLGALMIRNDRSAYSDKIMYLNSYFAQKFPHSHYHFGRSFTESLKNPIRPRTISRWLKRKLPQRKERMQIMYFLAGLSTVDGSMNNREVELLREMNHLLDLSPKDFESIIAMYTQRKERWSSNNPPRRVSAVELASKIIGVSVHASQDEIKKAYRNLVKLHHPDRFATDSVEQQKIAKQRFIEVQKAYEILDKK